MPDKAGRDTTITQAALAKITRTKATDLGDCMADAGVPLEAGGYNLFRGVTAALDRKEAILDGKSAADQRNIAQKRKLEVETAILEKKYRPVSEIQEAFSTVGAAITRVIEASGLSEPAKEELAQELAEAARPFTEEVEG